MKGKIHPSPVPTLSFLPPTILTLAAALSPEDKEVLAYLISFCGSTSSSNNNNNNNNNNTTADGYKTTHKSTRGGGEHLPLFDCNCFRCYKSFWARWDMSPNRQLIHEIIEAYEEGLFRENNKRSLKKKKKKKRGNKRVCDDDQSKSGESGSTKLTSSGGGGGAAAEDLGEGDHAGEDVDEVEEEKGSVAKVVNFIGERIWNFWGRN